MLANHIGPHKIMWATDYPAGGAIGVLRIAVDDALKREVRDAATADAAGDARG